MAAAGLMILAVACKENDTIKPTYSTTTYSADDQPEATIVVDVDSAVKTKRILPIKIQPIEQPVTNPSLGQGKDLPMDQVIN